MSPRHDLHTHTILEAIARGTPVSQRSMSRELGVALGLTNLIIKRLVRKGFVRIISVKPNRVKYFITPAGLAEKSRVSRAFLENTIHLYTETRARVRERFDELSSEWPWSDSPRKTIAFYGAGEVAEIAYVSIQGTDLDLVSVIDDRAEGTFFGLPIVRPEVVLAPDAGPPFAVVCVTSIRRREDIQQKLDAHGVPRDRVFAL